MPKAKPIPDNEEEEKTTIESQWEDEASTTVEQGDVADKIRALAQPARPNTNHTGTGAGQLDEPTVDDQHAPLSAITPLRDVARIVITQGNDTGQETEVRPGKTYTIGRAIDNDIVLTDIAVSRKHFDLRFDDGAWVVIDRGSGNGTVVNGNLEDNAFLLANGDVIEIGNTVFRFDQPNGASRSQPGFDPDDDEEMSTVAGKPLRAEIVEILEDRPRPPRPARPKTLPPPLPVRSASASVPPPLSLPPQPSTTLPLPQMANRAPLAGPGMPTILGDPVLPGMLPTTIPGQGVPSPRPIYPYPQATEIPPHSVHAQMLLIQTQNRRGDASTAHVPPAPYDVMVARPSRVYAQPQISKRAKLVLAAIGLAVFAAVSTIAVIKSGSAKPKPLAAQTGPNEKMKVEPAKPALKPTPPTVVPPPKPETASVTTAPAKTEPVKTATAPAVPPKTEPVKTVTTPTAPAKTEPIKTATMPTVPAKTEPVKAPPAKTEPVKAPPAKTEPVKTVATLPVKTETKPPIAKTETPKRDKKREARRDTAVATAPEPKAETPEPAPKRGGDTSGAETKAEGLYRQKKFGEASQVVAAAAARADEDKAKELRRTADLYAKLGKDYFNGMAPGGKGPTEAFEALRRAQNWDHSLGNAFDGEIQTKIGQVAPKAATTYMGRHDYPAARSALIAAEKFGAGDSVKFVRQKLESVAGDLVSEASKLLESNPAEAKEKLRQVKSIVDQSSTWWQKADKLLKGG